jgi:hypothetical protein
MRVPSLLATSLLISTCLLSACGDKGDGDSAAGAADGADGADGADAADGADGSGTDGGTDGGADTVLLDFEGDITVTGFGGAEASAVVADPTDGGNLFGEIVKSGEAADWAGATLSYCEGLGVTPLPFAEGRTGLTARVWSPDAGTPVLLKVENTGDGGTYAQTLAETTVAGDWEVLTFDLAEPTPETPAVDPDSTYDKVSVFFGCGAAGDGTTRTFYIDDVTFVGAAFDTDCPDLGGGGLPITFDDSAVSYELIGFGGAEDATLVTDPESGSGMVARVVKSDTAEEWAGTTVATLAGEAIPALPISASSTRMQVRVWSPRAGIPVRVKIETADDPTRSVETDAVISSADTWELLTFDFSNESTGTAALNPDYTFNQFSIFFDKGAAGADGGGGTFYFDDIDMAR